MNVKCTSKRKKRTCTPPGDIAVASDATTHAKQCEAPSTDVHASLQKKKKSCFGFVLVKKRLWMSSFLLCHLGGLHVLFNSLSCHSATLYFTNRVLPLNIAPNIKRKKKAAPQQSVTQKKKYLAMRTTATQKRVLKKKGTGFFAIQFRRVFITPKKEKQLYTP